MISRRSRILIVNLDRVILEQKDLEKLFQDLFVTKDIVGQISNSLYQGELIFALKRGFNISEFNFTIPDITVKNNIRDIQLSYKCSIIDYDSIDERIHTKEKYDINTVYDIFESGYYFLYYDNDPKQGIVINIDKEEISKFKLTYL